MAQPWGVLAHTGGTCSALNLQNPHGPPAQHCNKRHRIWSLRPEHHTEVLWSRISASVFKTNSDWHWKFYDTGTISCNPSFKSMSDRLVTWLASSPVNLRMKQFQNSTPSIEIGPSRRVPMKGDMYCNNVSMKWTWNLWIWKQTNGRKYGSRTQDISIKSTLSLTNPEHLHGSSHTKHKWHLNDQFWCSNLSTEPFGHGFGCLDPTNCIEKGRSIRWVGLIFSASIWTSQKNIKYRGHYITNPNNAPLWGKSLS